MYVKQHVNKAHGNLYVATLQEANDTSMPPTPKNLNLPMALFPLRCSAVTFKQASD